jgi:hypothetical protein
MLGEAQLFLLGWLEVLILDKSPLTSCSGFGSSRTVGGLFLVERTESFAGWEGLLGLSAACWR